MAYKAARVTVLLIVLAAGYYLGVSIDRSITSASLRWVLIVALGAGMVTIAELLLKVFRAPEKARGMARETRPGQNRDLSHEIAAEALLHQIAIRLAPLRELSAAKLAALPEWSTELVPFGDTRAELITYSILRADGSRSIVVQAVPEGTGLVWRNVHAAGFRVLPGGEKVPIGEPETFEFK